MSTDFVWCLPWAGGLIGCRHGLEHTFDPAAEPGIETTLAELTVFLDRLAARDLGRLPDTVRAERVQQLRQQVDRLEGQWLKELAGVDARGAAGAEAGPGGRLDRGLAPEPAASERPGGQPRMSGPPGPCSAGR